MVEDLTGESNIYVHIKRTNLWILREGKITYKYEPGYGPYTVVNFFRGYMNFSGTPSQDSFENGVFYQWVYLFAPESEAEQVQGYIEHAVWDTVMEGWLIGFSIYWQNTDPETYAELFPGSLEDFPRPVPAKNYNPLSL